MQYSTAGCQTCKSRHLKCDQTQPVCQRCYKSRRECAWADTVIHIENDFASRQKKRPRGPRSNPVMEKALVPTTPPGAGLIDLRSQALGFFMTYHLRNVRHVSSIVDTESEDFSCMLRSENNGPILDMSLSSIALAVFFRAHDYQPAALEASNQYTQLIQCARKRFDQIDADSVDACLLAVFFMSRYEDVIFTPEHLKGQLTMVESLHSVHHHDGALALLKIWKQKLSHELPPTNVIKHTRRGVIRSNIMRSKSLPGWLLDGLQFGERGSDLEYDSILVRISVCRSQLFDLLADQALRCQTASEFGTAVNKLLDETQAIDMAIQDWRVHFPESSSYHEHCFGSASSKDIWPTFSYEFPSTAAASRWCSYYGLYMLISSTRLRVLRLGEMNALTVTDCLKCLSALAAAADGLAASALPLLQRPDLSGETHSLAGTGHGPMSPYLAGVIVWPLSLAASLTGVNPKQRAWFQSQLVQVGRTLGIGVLQMATTDGFLEI